MSKIERDWAHNFHMKVVVYARLSSKEQEKHYVR